MATLPQHMVRPCAPTVVCDGAGEMPKPCLVEPPWGGGAAHGTPKVCGTQMNNVLRAMASSEADAYGVWNS